LKPRDIRELVLTLAATTLDFMVGLVAAAAAGAVEVGAWLATAPAVAEARRLTPARASLVSLGGLDGSREVVGGGSYGDRLITEAEEWAQRAAMARAAESRMIVVINFWTGRG
jgi:hypothetical protein